MSKVCQYYTGHLLQSGNIRSSIEKFVAPASLSSSPKMRGKISKWPSVSERKSCVYYAGREVVLSVVGNEGRPTSQGANCSGERRRATCVVVTEEDRAVGNCSASEVRPSEDNNWWFRVPFVTRLVLKCFRVPCDWPVHSL